jgi:hypothetical protein
VASKSKVTLTVENHGVQASAGLNAAAAVHAIFVLSGTQAAAINGDGNLNGADHPAPVGSTVALFLTGAGGTPADRPRRASLSAIAATATGIAGHSASGRCGRRGRLCGPVFRVAGPGTGEYSRSHSHCIGCCPGPSHGWR